MKVNKDIKYLRHHQIDKQLWDQTIDNSSNGLIFGYSWYLDLLSPGWEALVTDDYETIMPLTRKCKFGLIPYLCQPYFMQQTGIFSKNEISASTLQKFLKKIPLKFMIVNLHLNTGNPAEFFPHMKIRTTYQLSLSASYEQIQKAYNKDAHKNLRKAREVHPVISWDFHPGEVIALYKSVYGKMNPDIRNQDYHQFEKVLNYAQKPDKAFTLQLFNNHDDLLASGAFLKSHGYIHYVMGAATEKGRQCSAVHLLIDEVIKKYSGQDMIFDFEGSEIPSVAAFYEKFGPEKAFFYHYARRLW